VRRRAGLAALFTPPSAPPPFVPPRRPWGGGAGAKATMAAGRGAAGAVLTCPKRRSGKPVMRRREFIAVLGGAAPWPFAVRAQQPVVPLVDYVAISSAGAEGSSRVPGFKQGLSQTGYVEAQNVTIEYRYLEGRFDHLPALAEDLVRRKPTAIMAGGPPWVRALKARTASIPIVFAMGEDPVKEGLVASLNRPGENITGVSSFQNLLFPKRLQLLHEIVPRPAALAFLVNSNNPNAAPDSQDARTAANVLERELVVLTASNERGLEEAFATLVQRRVGGLIVGVDGLFVDRRDQVFALAARHAIPAIYDRREFPEAGGLMSYGTNDRENFRQCGIYVGRILGGEKPSNLPVVQSTRSEFFINLRIAKVLGLEIPPGVLAIADQVIE
jgi:putative ABC transport system substrate-binding protein